MVCRALDSRLSFGFTDVARMIGLRVWVFRSRKACGLGVYGCGGLGSRVSGIMRGLRRILGYWAHKCRQAIGIEGFTVGASIIRIGFWEYYTIIKIRNPQTLF